MPNLLKRAIWLQFLIATFYCSCKKQDDFLNVKKNNSDVVLSTLADYQALLDNNGIMNTYYPDINILGADNYYLTNSVFASLIPPYNTAYLWESDIWQGAQSADWNDAYQVIEYANISLNGISSAADTSANTSYNNIKGSALFYRAFEFYLVAGEFCKPYTASSAANDLGIPIRTTSNVNAKSIRSTVEQTYNQIISDLKEAMPLLPNLPLFTTRPSAAATAALLAKVYLSMEDYQNALTYANAALGLQSTLIDYNNTALVKPTSTYPFPSDPYDNPEIMFYSSGEGYGTVDARGEGIPDSNLYNSYSNNDLRKTVLFWIKGGNVQFRGSYAKSGYNFTGIGVNEIYLVRAECNARLGNSGNAIQDLNTLLSHRYLQGTYNDIATSDTTNLINLIIQERRRELPFTGLIRWEDLRRLNKDPNYAITLTRVVNGTTYNLQPNDPRYIYPIPDNEIQLSGIQQNNR